MAHVGPRAVEEVVVRCAPTTFSQPCQVSWPPIECVPRRPPPPLGFPPELRLDRDEVLVRVAPAGLIQPRVQICEGTTDPLYRPQRPSIVAQALQVADLREGVSDKIRVAAALGITFRHVPDGQERFEGGAQLETGGAEGTLAREDVDGVGKF